MPLLAMNGYIVFSIAMVLVLFIGAGLKELYERCARARKVRQSERDLDTCEGIWEAETPQ